METPETHDGLVVGVISDTHDHLHPEVKELLDGVDHIIHAGDVCSPGVLAELRKIAPVTAVRGNCDYGFWAEALPARADIALDGVRIVVGHIGGRLREEGAARPAGAGPAKGGARGADVVISGHSHQAMEEHKDGVLHLNPGSAGPRRFGRPRTMAFLRISPKGDGLSPADRVSVGFVVLEG